MSRTVKAGGHPQKAAKGVPEFCTLPRVSPLYGLISPEKVEQLTDHQRDMLEQLANNDLRFTKKKLLELIEFQCQLYIRASEKTSRLTQDRSNAPSISETEIEKAVQQRLLGHGVRDITSGRVFFKQPNPMPVDSEDGLFERAVVIVNDGIKKGKLDHIVEILENDAEQEFNDFKKLVKGRKESEIQFAVAQRLNAIEERVNHFPLLSPKEAALCLGEVSATNPSRVISKARDEKRIFSFTFGESKTMQIPAFQFDMQNLGTYPAIPKLCQTLSGLSDWGVYLWLTSDSEDLECTPAEALQKPELENDLLYLAGLYKTSNTFRELDYTAADATGEDSV